MPERIHLTRNDIKQYGMSPVGVVTPMYIGQYCITDDDKVYFAKGLTSNDWIEAIDLSGLATKEEIDVIKEDLSKTENTKYTTVNGIKEFNCKDGYIDNVAIEGETLVNYFDKASWYDNDVLGAFYTLPLEKDKTYKFFHSGYGDKMVLFCDEYGMVFNGSTFVCQIDGKINYALLPITESGEIDSEFIYNEKEAGLNEELLTQVIITEDTQINNVSYFEGIKSVGQGDKIEVLSCTDNIYSDTNKTVGKILSGEGVLIDYPSHDCSDYIVIEPNSIYYTNIPHGFIVYDANKNIIDNKALVAMSFVSGKYIMPNNAKYLRINLDKDTSNYLITKKYDKKQISTTLRSLPNGVKDTIEKRGNKYVKVQRCGEVTLNGSEDIIVSGATGQGDTKAFLLNTSVTGPMPLYTNVMCDKFKSNKSLWREDIENIILAENGKIYFKINVSKLSSQDVTGIKEWLKLNPTTVVYELATPIITELHNFNPQTYEGNTTLLLNSGTIQGECEFEVTNSIGSEIEVLKDKVSSLDSDILSNTVTIYSMDLHNGVTATGNNLYGILQLGNSAIATAELYTDTDLPYGTSIGRLHKAPVRAFYPLNLLCVSADHNTIVVKGWLYEGGIIATLGNIPAKSFISFTVPYLTK